MLKAFIFLFPAIALSVSCTEPSETKAISVPVTEPIQKVMTDTTIELHYNGNPVQVIFLTATSEFKGNILLLHGWNLPPMEWCEKTELCSLARAAGYNLIIPDFGKTTYHWQVYPETKANYLPYPTRAWMYDTFLRYCQDSMSVLKPGQNNSAIGLSTGGRGSALFALEKPDIFRACVALSADFDQTSIADEPINNGYYGAYTLFPNRWEGRDNIYNRAEEWKVPVYLGHGTEDKICPTGQTIDFYKRLTELGFTDVTLSTPAYGHTYEYWGSETENILNFLRSVQ